MADDLIIDVDDSVLIVIDVQPTFLDKLPGEEAEKLLERICWLIGVARWADVPVVVTAEDMARNGTVHPTVERALAHGTPVYDKMSFALTAEPAILEAVRAVRRNTMVIVGLETDVCVAQSALGLSTHGFRVAVVSDALGSPGSDHDHGLGRMRAAGVIVSGVKGLFYEWMRTVQRSEKFHEQCDANLGIPESLRF